MKSATVKTHRNVILIALMFAGEAIFFLPFVVARVFRPTFLEVFEINNLQLGTAFSLYGIIAMASYFLGGPIADRFSPKKLMTSALVITALGGLIMALIPSLFGLTLLYGFWGISTILLYWAASIKAIRNIGSTNKQGLAFGLVDGGRGLVAALLASISVFIFDALLPSNVEEPTTQQLSSALGYIILLFSGLIILSAVLIWIVFPNDDTTKTSSMSQLSLSGIKNVIRRRSVWLQSLILLCAYVGYKCTDDFSLYANEVFGYNNVESAHIGTISFWMRPIATLAAGILGDQFRHSKMMSICFLIVIFTSLIISFGLLKPGLEFFIILTIATTSAGIYGLRGLYFAVMQETNVPFIYTGSAVGFISLIGYTPDVFMGPLMGYVLDNNPGATGHQYLFGILAAFSLIGLIFSLNLQKISNLSTHANA